MKKQALIVAYQPERQALAALCGTLLEAGCAVMVLDNSESAALSAEELPGVQLVSLGENRGIASAQNEGIRLARQQGAHLIVFFDQDGRIERTDVERLCSGFDAGVPRVVGPVFFDEAKGFEFPAYRLSRWGWPRKILAQGQTQPYPADLLISSGTAVSMATFDCIGGMDEDFFIDYVDLEWFIRCWRAGIPVLVDPGVRMRHSVGSHSIDAGLVTTFVHGPARTYYKLRNIFLLFRKRHVPLSYALRELASGAVHHLIALLHVQQRAAYLAVYLAAFRDGLAGRFGKRRQEEVPPRFTRGS